MCFGILMISLHFQVQNIMINITIFNANEL